MKKTKLDTDTWERLENDLVPVSEALKAGQLSPGRAMLFAELAKVGLPVTGAAELDPARSGDAPCMLVAYLRTTDYFLMLATIPIAKIDASHLATMEKDEVMRSNCVSSGDTSYTEPEVWEAWIRFALGVGAHAVDELDTQLEMRTSEGIENPKPATLKKWHGSYERYVAWTNEGGGDLARLAVPIVDYWLLREDD